MADRRIVCVWMPRFRLAVVARERPTTGPIAIFRPSGRTRELVECPPELEAEGMRPGMPLKEAESRWPAVRFLSEEPEQYARALGPVLEALDAFSPSVEVATAYEAEGAGPGVAFLDGTGLEPLYGPEEQLGRRIAATVAETTGYAARVGIAGGKFAARLAALATSLKSQVLSPESQEDDDLGPGTWDSRLVRVVPPGQDVAFLAPLSVGLLPLPVEARERVARLGLRTLGEFARLPASAVRHRFGPDGVRARALAAGCDDEPLRPRPTPLVVRDELEFEWVEESLDRLTFALKRLADRLSARLLRHGLGCAGLEVTWRLEDGSTRAAMVRLAERAASGGRLLEHLRWHVEELRLGGGVCGIAVEARELAPISGQQLKLLPGEDGRAPRPERLLRAGDVLARLRARWGDEAVRRAEPVVSRRPEAAFRWVENLTPRPPSLKGRGRRTDGSPPPSREGGTGGVGLWLEPEEVEVCRGGVGPKDRAVGPSLRRGGRARRIVHAEGPWRLVEPWSAEPVARDTYQVETADGEACWLVYEHAGGRWHLLGVFD